jgi:hypothetical protein
MNNEDEYNNHLNDFHYNNEKNKNYDKLDKAYERFIEDVFKKKPSDAPFHENPGCKFTEKVMDYLYFEWMIDVTVLSHDQQAIVIDTINSYKGAENVNNTCAYIIESLKIFGN